MAILAEKYAVDYTWYVDTILNLIRIAGDYVSEEVINGYYYYYYFIIVIKFLLMCLLENNLWDVLLRNC